MKITNKGGEVAGQSPAALKDGLERYDRLVASGAITGARLLEAAGAAAANGADIETVLVREYKVPRRALLQALSDHYHCPFIEYDERLPIAPGLLDGLDGEMLSVNSWFPVIREGDTVVIAANRPDDPTLSDKVRSLIPAREYIFWVALDEEIQWFIEDYLNGRPGALIGTERTGLAFWRNTMAHWRTRLACYRTDLAEGRTDLAFLRWGLGIVVIADTLMRVNASGTARYLYPLLLTAGLCLSVFGLAGYLKIRKSRMSPPGHHTLVEVTAATVSFLEKYHFIEGAPVPSTKRTMLGRLGDNLAYYSTILPPHPASKVRTQLARERNVLAAQRTVLACYRTIYARARTGLAFIRTGVSFAGIGLGFIKYFGVSLYSIFDVLLISAGTGMVIDGLRWYLPVRKEQTEIPRSVLPRT